MFKQLLMPFRGLLVRLAYRLAPCLAPLVYFMARTGAGTDACLRFKCLPLPVHFYSPVPDLADLERRKVWERKSALAGVDFRSEAQLTLLRQLGSLYGDECRWPGHQTGDPYQFHTENGTFSYGCAAALHCLVRQARPRRIVEIGSGNSSLVIAAAVGKNLAEDPNRAVAYEIVDPYPRDLIAAGLKNLTHLHREGVETLPPEFFDRLGDGDVLFIDSGHTVRIGSDVNYLFLEILPRLAPGVIIHIHDIPLPYEYPKVYATSPTFRVFWTESYLLQAFLAFNSEFEVLLGMAYLMTEQGDEFRAAFPPYDPSIHKAVSGSFWIRRKKTGHLNAPNPPGSGTHPLPS